MAVSSAATADAVVLVGWMRAVYVEAMAQVVL
jgi:hypothetical protein